MIKKFIASIALLILISGCASNNVQESYNNALNTYQQVEVQKAQQMTAMADICKEDSNPGLCLAMMNQQSSQSNTKMPEMPRQQTHPIWGIIGNAIVPGITAWSNIRISESNNETRRDIAVSNNQMMSDIVGGGYDAMASAAARDSVSVNGDYISGDGVTNGDGNIRGDGNGDGDRYGNNAVVGDGNGDGDRYGNNADVVGRDQNSGDNNQNSGRIESPDSQNGDDRDNDNSDNSDNSGDGG